MDVVIVGFPGVQTFIEAGRTTADLWAASDVRSRMAASAAKAIAGELEDGERLIFPAVDPNEQAGVPNRLVAIARDGRGPKIAANAVTAARSYWLAQLEKIGQSAVVDQWAIDRAPVVTAVASGSDYRYAWSSAQLALVAERRVRRFDGMFRSSPVGACRACGAAPAIPTPQGLEPVMRNGELLCVVCLVKRSHRYEERARFPSTSTIAAAPFIADAVVARGEDAKQAIVALRDAVKAMPSSSGSFRSIRGLQGMGVADRVDFDGDWCFVESWDPAVLARQTGTGGTALPGLASAGKAAASALAGALGWSPSPYLAVIAQDADHLGTHLSEGMAAVESPVEFHERVSGLLLKAAAAQREVLEGADILGRVVYAGGDDLLALTPVRTAVRAAVLAQRAFREQMERVTASSAVVFFHRSYPLAAAMRRARDALALAKSSGRDRVALVELRRGGERAEIVVPWQRGTLVLEAVDAQVAAFRGHLSSRLVSSIAREAHGLDELPDAARELALQRLVGRHGGAADDTARLVRLLNVCGSAGTLVELLTIARFLAREGR